MKCLGALMGIFGGWATLIASTTSVIPADTNSTGASAETNAEPVIATNTPAAPTNPPVLATTNTTARRTSAPPTVSTSDPAAVAAFRVERGFKIELVASDPLVASPAAMAFDENGRLFVAEMRDYPNRGAQRLGQVRVLEDSQGEGVFSASTIFATNLPLASALVCYGGGVFVAAAPNIFFLQDTDGNGVADVQRVVFTGFGATNAVNPNALPHSFYWGLDNRIYGANGGVAVTVSGNGDDVLLDGKDFSFDPRTLSITPEAGLALSGMTRDDWGRRFPCSNARPLQVEVIEERYLARNPFFAPADPVEDIAGPAVAVFRPQAPGERKITTGRGTNDYVPAWIANARGAVVYRSSLFPSNYYGNIFVADADTRLIHRAVIRDTGYALRAERPPENFTSEFLACTDPSFRPTHIVNGPEGALYVADINNGEDTGRIYRIAPSSFRPFKSPRLSTLGTRELVAMLVHTNAFHRDTASRLLFERRDPAATPLLASMATRSKVPLARVNALHALAAAGAFTDALAGQAMADPDWRVRAQGLWLAEGFAREGTTPNDLWARMRMLARDPVFSVRLQAALTGGSVAMPDRPAMLRDILARDPANLLIQTAVLSSSHDGGATLLRLITEEPRIPEEIKAAFLARLADMIGVSGIMNEVQGVIDYIASPGVPRPLALRIAWSLGEGLQRTRSSLRLVDFEGRLRPLFALALVASVDWNLAEVYRTDAIRLLGSGPYEMQDGGMVALSLLNGSEPASIQSAALRSLSSYNSPQLTPGVLQRWGNIVPGLRGQAVATLTRRAEQVPVVLTLIENGNIPAGDVPAWQHNIFRHWGEPAVAERANRIFGPLEQTSSLVIEKLRPAVGLTGIPARGQSTFASRCAMCHSIRTPLPMPGPDLAHVKVFGKEGILNAIIEPSARIAPRYTTAVIRTLTGEVALGTVARENPSTVVLREPGRGPTVWPRLNIESIQLQRWSLMPEGLEQGLDTRGLADLMQYLLVQ